MTEFGCENETLLLHCPLLSQISIVRANYGRFSLSVCNFRALENIHTNCDSSHTTTDILKNRYQTVPFQPSPVITDICF